MNSVHGTFNDSEGISRKTAGLVGGLFLTAMAASLIGGGMVESIITSPDFLTAVSEHEQRLLVGVLLELINGMAVVGIGALMFPVLKKINESMAIMYLCFRAIEALFACLIVITPLSLLKLSQEYFRADPLDSQYFQAAGSLAIALRAGINDLPFPLFFCLGAMLFYLLLYRSGLLPRFISIWGVIATICILLMNLLTLFREAPLNPGVLVFLALPIILNEIFLGIWLMVRGFNPLEKTFQPD